MGEGSCNGFDHSWSITFISTLLRLNVDQQYFDRCKSTTHTNMQRLYYKFYGSVQLRGEEPGEYYYSPGDVKGRTITK